MMSELNMKHSGKYYPLFLGEPLGIIENINVQYPQIANIRDRLLAAQWPWDEYSLAKDAIDIVNPALKEQVDILICTLSFQMAGDSIASRSVWDILGGFCTNNELQGLLQFITWNEYVHGMSYSEIVRSAFQNSNDMLDSIKNNENVLKRAKNIGKIFRETHLASMEYQINGLKNHNKRYFMKNIVKYLVTMLAMEAISFTASFASSFALCRSANAFPGINSTIEVIAKDELMHAEAGYTMISILKNDAEWKSVFDEEKSSLTSILDTLLAMEWGWAEYLFSEGRKIVGLNTQLLKDYVTWIAKDVYAAIGATLPVDGPAKNPLPWMDDSLNVDSNQSMAQEMQINNYRTNSVVKDSGDELECNF